MSRPSAELSLPIATAEELRSATCRAALLTSAYAYAWMLWEPLDGLVHEADSTRLEELLPTLQLLHARLRQLQAHVTPWTEPPEQRVEASSLVLCALQACQELWDELQQVRQLRDAGGCLQTRMAASDGRGRVFGRAEVIRQQISQLQKATLSHYLEAASKLDVTPHNPKVADHGLDETLQDLTRHRRENYVLRKERYLQEARI